MMAAYGKVGMVCSNCHDQRMVMVEQKYHWGNFDAIQLTDPVSHRQVGWIQLMQYLDANFAGISLSVGRNDTGTAQTQFDGFNARFQTLKEACSNCHTTDRKYFVDSDVQTLIDELGLALSDGPTAVGPLVQGIGAESCMKCHYVHLPAALARF